MLSKYWTRWSNFPFAIFYRNTVFVTFVNAVGVLLSASLVAFGFAHRRFIQGIVIGGIKG